MFLCGLFFMIENIDVASYTYDNTPYIHGKFSNNVLEKLVHSEIYLNGFLIKRQTQIQTNVIFSQALI